jgi:hypothetical protein
VTMACGHWTTWGPQWLLGDHEEATGTPQVGCVCRHHWSSSPTQLTSQRVLKASEDLSHGQWWSPIVQPSSRGGETEAQKDMSI